MKKNHLSMSGYRIEIMCPILVYHIPFSPITFWQVKILCNIKMTIGYGWYTKMGQVICIPAYNGIFVMYSDYCSPIPRMFFRVNLGIICNMDFLLCRWLTALIVQELASMTRKLWLEREVLPKVVISSTMCSGVSF